MRIRHLLFALTLVIPVAAHAVATDVEQQGGWTLRTSTSGQMTKDYFCASEGHFSHDFALVVARNLLGQSSLVLTWPGFTGAPGTSVPMRISVDQKTLRDVQAVAKGNNTLVAALGWDDEALGKLGAAKRITFAASVMNVRYNAKDNNAAFARLNSCTASLLDRLPDSKGLSSEVRRTLDKAHLGEVRMIQVADSKNSSENFLVDGTFGGSAVLDKGKSDVTQRMLDYVDQLELLCRARFSSQLGAPIPVKGGELIMAEAKCDTLHTGTITALAFVNDGSKPRVYYFEADKSNTSKVTALRDRLADAVKGE